MSVEKVVSLIPAVDGPWFAVCPDGKHRRVVAWQLVHGIDDSDQVAPETYEMVQAVVPRYEGGIEGVAPVDDIYHADELPCVAQGTCGGHEAHEDAATREPVDLRRARKERAAS
jgi:hypothetical protein